MQKGREVSGRTEYRHADHRGDDEARRRREQRHELPQKGTVQSTDRAALGAGSHKRCLEHVSIHFSVLGMFVILDPL